LTVAHTDRPSLYRITTDADKALQAGGYPAAAQLYTEALTHDAVPAYQRAAILSNLGLSWQNLGEVEKAATCFEQAVATNPNLSSARIGVGTIYALRGSHAAALEQFDRALALDPRSAVAHNNRALSLEALGRLDEAWQEAEWRYALPTATAHYPHRYAKPRWKGEPLGGRTLLVHREQGLGDVIQYLRFLRFLDRFDAAVKFECPKPLLPLVSPTPWLEVIPAKARPVPEDLFDCSIPLLSLPHALGFRAVDLPSTSGYLASVQAAEKKSPERQSLKIGFVWSGSAFDPRRNAALSDFLPLSRLEASLVSLQKDVGDPEREQMSARGIENLGHAFRDFGDTRDAIAALDLVVAVDTAVAHLAGALGKRTWLLLNDPAAVRWMIDRTDSPWYPTMMIRRRRENQSWAELIAGVASEIEREAALALAPGNPDRGKTAPTRPL
jgi:tetratricopeptide (TPR) repeat protein